MLRTTKALMLATDVGFVVYFTVTGLGLIPPEWAFAGYADPVMVAWNWSFLWIDLAASATGLTSLWLLRRAATSSPVGGPSAVGSGAAHGTPLMLVSLVLTMASGLMAVAFWTLRGDFFLDLHGKECLAVMGCYGIGVGRTIASAIEQNHDPKGIIWPFPIAPFHVHLLSLTQTAQTAQAARQLYDKLQAGGLEVLWDDRDERAGVKFNDADLMGAPFQVAIGDKGLAEGIVEVKTRKDGMKLKLPLANVVSHLTGARPG